tara:strand:- start:2422 stop:4101 length:1680 start_codon:yes stop_codon:yes gene_type:complete
MNNLLISDTLEINKKEKKYNKMLLIISFLIGIIGLVIIMRLVEVSFPKKNFNIADKNEIKKIDYKNRGMLLDRNDRILASNIYIYNLKAYPKKIKDPLYTLNMLNNHISLNDSKTLLEKLKNKKKYEVLIKKNITAPQAKSINNLGIPGVEFVPVIKRLYPHREITAHFVGHVNGNMVGQLGAERTFNNRLHLGENINLGIDIRLQYIVRDELEKGRIKYNSKSATAIIADLNSGEILSLVSLPDFNPNQSINPELNSYTNTATLNLYEMGSTFKMFTIAAALDLSQVNLETKFDASKSIKIANYEIKDYKPQNRILSTKEIFLNSSNIGSSLIALELGKLKLRNFYEKIGLLNISNINLSEKTKPIIPKKWGKIQTATLSFGHGLSISPIQMIEASSKLFNNNLDYKTQIHKKNKDNTIEKIEFLSENTINTLKYLMYENTLNGTAKKAKLNGYKIGGKTATGEKAEKGKYDETKLISSFLSVFPIEKPKFISLVLFDEPSLGSVKKYREGATGGKTAAPVTANIYRRIFPILGITKNYNSDPELLVDNKGELNFVSY